MSAGAGLFAGATLTGIVAGGMWFTSSLLSGIGAPSAEQAQAVVDDQMGPLSTALLQLGGAVGVAGLGAAVLGKFNVAAGLLGGAAGAAAIGLLSRPDATDSRET